MSNEITVEEFETKVRKVEGIFFMIRAKRAAKVPDYPHETEISGNRLLYEFIEERIRPLLGMGGFEFIFLNADIREPHLATKVSTIRKSFDWC